MENVPNSEILDTQLNTSFTSGNGLALRVIILDAFQRYHATGNKENLSPQEKKNLIINLTKAAAYEAKDGMAMGYAFIKFNLTLNPAQKELAARAYEKFFAGIEAKQLAGFLDNEQLSSLIKKMPANIKDSDPKELENSTAKIAKNENGGNSLSMTELYASKAIFEEVAKSHGILYYKKDGIEQKLGDCLNDAIKEVKDEIKKKLEPDQEVSSGKQSSNYAQPLILPPLPTSSGIANKISKSHML